MPTTRRVLLRLVASTVLCWAAVVATGAGADTASLPTGDPSARRTQAESSLTLLGQTPVVAPSDEWQVDLGLAGTSGAESLAFTLYEPIVSGRDGLDDTISGARLGRRLRAPLSVPVANLPVVGGAVQARFQIVSEGDNPLVGFRLSTPGVYPVAIDLLSADGTTLDTLVTHIIRLPAPQDPDAERLVALGVATVIPLRAPLATGTDGGRTVDEAARAWLAEVVDAIEAHPEVASSIAPSPETVDVLANGDAGPDPLVDTLRTALGDRQVVSSTYVPLDVGAYVEVGLTQELADQRAAGRAVLDLELVGERPLDDRTWIADGSLTGPALDVLRADGIDRVVFAERDLDPLADGQTLTRPFDVVSAAGTAVPAAAADARLSDRLTATDDPILNAHLALADLTLIQEERPDEQGVVVLAVPLGSTPPATVDELLSGLGEAGRDRDGAETTLAAWTLDDAFAVPPATAPATTTGAVPLVRTWVPVAGTGLGTYPASLDAAQISVDGFDSMVAATAPELVLPLRRLLLVSGAAGLEPDVRQDYLDAATATVNDQVAGIRAPEQPVVNLTAREATVPVELVNELDYPVEVRVVFASEKLEFPDGEIVLARLEPGSNRLEVRVQARASGTFPVEIRLFSPDSGIALPRTEVTVRSTAVSGLGLVLSIGAGVFLLIWWGRHLHRTRQNRRLVPQQATGEVDADADADRPSAPTSGPSPVP
ncbi:MAG: DUF6049 family protein [Acidimicrobiales bacterium]|nr:DUF6049 family protein [Acidimicrobiales bacterium]